MFDARIFIEELETAREILQKSNADFKGDYEIHDYIYTSKDSTKNLTDEFMRLRVMPKNIWNEKDVIVAIKKTDLKEVGKTSHIPLRNEFDSPEEGLKFIEENLLDTYEPAFDFHRIGWQYNLGENQVDLEDIELGHFSIEFKSPTEEGLQKLLTDFSVTHDQVIIGPSVVAMEKLLIK